ncbi:uncharacterized protein TRIADDRAFT_59586 [Trichoplax adhaerens]|uniref:Death domain-containing protein n=1 Tax=Trichoplax adhaerens TaxID=10228 RepID=B3S5E3_TRIAD|nr:predicted protein [Trichoplax adhaerens]EDV22022.1 predicted protein [Trichoplax adhaerens]|eukprot:XP_002115659.1 predicted protein [Trichoplax adhaerens]
MISREARNVFRKYLRRLYKETPSIEIINELVVEKILSSCDAKRLRKIDEESERNFELIDILQKRRDEDIVQFCKILQDCDVQTVQELGKELETKLMKVIKTVDSNSGEASSSVNEDRIGADAVISSRIVQQTNPIDSSKNGNNSEPFDKYFRVIAGELRYDLAFRLGNTLRLKTNEIEEIKGTNSARYDKMYKILEFWKNERGTNADIAEVITALRSMNQNLIADKIQKI